MSIIHLKRRNYEETVGVACVAGPSDLVFAQDKVLKMSTTTSTESSGLLEVLLPEFKKDTGIEVKVVAKGTGAAIGTVRTATWT
jgi:ABC-type tungstate transport system permease subunit